MQAEALLAETETNRQGRPGDSDEQEPVVAVVRRPGDGSGLIEYDTSTFF
jgi:hypothetical protein